MSDHYEAHGVTVHHGDCLDVLRGMPAASVDAVVTDPPYGLEFMGKDWDRPWAVGAAQGVGYAGREDNLTLPSHRDSRNANCRACGGRQRGAKRCACATPEWDRHPREDMLAFQQWCEEWAAECLRVLKPGGHMLAFGGTRTWHRLACAIEDAGFEIRDTITWLYGSGFPKSLDVGKAIDRLNGKPLDRLREFGAHVRSARETAGLTQAEVNRAMETPQGCGWWEGKGAGDKWDLHLPSRATWAKLRAVIPTLSAEWDWLIEWAEAERAVIGDNPYNALRGRSSGTHTIVAPQAPSVVTAPATEDAARWDGWGTALKPASEPIVVARKPLAGTVAANVLTHGTGALNIAATRVAGLASEPNARQRGKGAGLGYHGGDAPGGSWDGSQGRWPSNVVLSHGDCTEDGCEPPCPVAELDAQTGTLTSGANPARRGSDKFRDAYGDFKGQEDCTPARGADSGGASRFFPTFRYEAKADATERPRAGSVAHPTVKPLDLMRWLVRLVTPPGGLVLDPFAGSGTTAEACLVEGFRCVTIEREADYLPLIVDRITKRADPVANLTAKAGRGEDVDLGLFGLLEDGAA